MAAHNSFACYESYEALVILCHYSWLSLGETMEYWLYSGRCIYKQELASAEIGLKNSLLLSNGALYLCFLYITIIIIIPYHTYTQCQPDMWQLGKLSMTTRKTAHGASLPTTNA